MALETQPILLTLVFQTLMVSSPCAVYLAAEQSYRYSEELGFDHSLKFLKNLFKKEDCLKKKKKTFSTISGKTMQQIILMYSEKWAPTEYNSEWGYSLNCSRQTIVS